MIFLTVLLGLVILGGLIIPSILMKGISASDRYGAEKKTIMKRLRLFIPLGTAILMVIILFFGSMLTIDQTEVGVVKTFGQITGTLPSGINFVNPLTDTVTKYDTKVRSATLTFASYTKDAQPIDVVVEVQYNLTQDSIMSVASSYGAYEVLEAKLLNVIEERIKVVLSRKSATGLMETRADLSHEGYSEVSDLSTTFPIHFTSVIVKDVAFSDAFEASVEAKMTAEQAALKAEQDKKTAIINAEKAKEVARIEAEGKVLTAQGEADSMMITKEALEAMPEAYIEQLWLQRWDGKLPQIMTDGSNLMITPNLGE